MLYLQRKYRLILITINVCLRNKMLFAHFRNIIAFIEKDHMSDYINAVFVLNCFNLR